MNRGILLAAGLVMIVLFGVGCGPKPEPKPEPVSKAEYQEFQAEVRGGLKIVDARVAEIEKAMPEIQKGLSEIKGQIEDLQKDFLSEGKIKELQDQLKAEKAQKLVDELKVKMEALEKSLAEAKASWQPYQPWQPSYSPTGYGTGFKGFWIEQPGRYEFIVTPYYVEFFVDGQRVTNNQVVYLTRGWHNCWSNSDFSFRTNWVGY